ncbi:hypothetical protein [Dysgonomonas termitidis]|uniref:BZIP transcription factor n=1 Tax=Dysgonomonas termitidis TaxID=1516126 RepID=A0ABV9L4L7_9BACT
MRKNIVLIILFILSVATYSQDQAVNGNLIQQLNNQWLSPAKLQLGRSNADIIENKAVIGVTNGNLHLDPYPGYALYLNYYQRDSNSGNKGMMISPSGNVGIGTNNPQRKLDVRGGQNLGGTLYITSPYAGGYCEGIRISAGSNNWATIALGSTGDSGTGENVWSIHRTNNNDFSISRNSPDGANGMVITKSGNIGLGTINPQSKLEVNGIIRSKEVKIEATGWSDFVFNKDYNLRPLSEVETHIKKHKHLPEIPSEKEVLENGISVGEIQAKLLQKIEELTLYVIEQDKAIKSLKEENREIKSQLKNVKP